jgi:hypothetical protein
MQPKNGEQGLQRTDYCNNKNIALLTKKERNWLLGNLSLPLLIKNKYIIPYEPESLGTGLGDRRNYNNLSLGKAKVPGPNPGQGSPIFVKARYEDLIDLIILLPVINKIVASISFYIMTIRVAWNSI